VLVLSAGAIASAFSPSIWWLIGFRIILRLGVGGDYPVSSTLMSEYAGKATRGMMVSLVFAMQAAGLSATTFIYPSELFPVETRTTGMGSRPPPARSVVRRSVQISLADALARPADCRAWRSHSERARFVAHCVAAARNHEAYT
jgi:hypothetical protein